MCSEWPRVGSWDNIAFLQGAATGRTNLSFLPELHPLASLLTGASVMWPPSSSLTCSSVSVSASHGQLGGQASELSSHFKSSSRASSRASSARASPVVSGSLSLSGPCPLPSFPASCPQTLIL